MNDLRLRFRRGDWLAILLVAVLALGIAAAFASNGNDDENRKVQVYLDGALIHELSLLEDASLQVDGEYSNTITIQNGRAAITASDCPGEDCVHSGWIDQAGRSIVCLPNRVELRITGAADVDFAVG